MKKKSTTIRPSLSRCSKLFYTISKCYSYIESTFPGASVSFVLSHMARYAPFASPVIGGQKPSPKKTVASQYRTFNVKLISNTYLGTARMFVAKLNLFGVYKEW